MKTTFLLKNNGYSWMKIERKMEKIRGRFIIF